MTNTKSKTACHIRWMIRRDFKECEKINTSSFSNQHLQWLVDDFALHLKVRDNFAMVVEANTHVVGYMAYGLRNQTILVASLAVHPDHRHQGIGRMMVEKLIGKLDYHHRKELIVEIEETNLDSQLFFRSHGFNWFKTVRPSYSEHSFYQMKYRVGKDTE